jgi:phosphoribosylformylglycinamidine cyclo-ligase
MQVHQCYAPVIFKLLNKFEIHGMAHITGGGIPGNLNRIIPDGLGAVVHKQAWPTLPVFDWLGKVGNLDTEDMYSAFNMGIGYIMVVPAREADSIISALDAMNETGYKIGTIERGAEKVRLI